MRGSPWWRSRLGGTGANARSAPLVLDVDAGVLRELVGVEQLLRAVVVLELRVPEGLRGPLDDANDGDVVVPSGEGHVRGAVDEDPILLARRAVGEGRFAPRGL